MGDEDGDRRQRAEVVAQRGPQRHRRSRVQRGRRLVEQQQRRFAGQRPGDRHPLRLAARHLARTAVSQRRDVQPPQPGRGHVAGLLLASSPRPQAEGNVVGGGEVREQQVVLEHEANRPPMCRQLMPVAGQDGAVQRDLPARDREQSGERSQRRCLPGPVGPDQADDLTALRCEVDLGQLSRPVYGELRGQAHAGHPT